MKSLTPAQVPLHLPALPEIRPVVSAWPVS